MTPSIRFPTIVLAMVLFSMAEAHAQPVDPDAFQVWMQEAWEDVGQASFPDSLQRTYGRAFFTYHQQHPRTELGAEAGWQAFLMWSNAGAVTEIDEALAQLPDDAELWSYILHYVERAYAASERRDADDLYALLTDLENRLTHPASRSAVLLQLARYYQAHERQNEAQRSSRRS